MFLIGALPVVLLPYIWFKVPEYPRLAGGQSA